MKKFLSILLTPIALLSFVHPIFAQSTPEEIIGSVSPPPGVEVINADVGAGNIGILFFASNVIKFITIIAGLFVFINLIMAAFIYITGGGKAKNHQKVVDKVTMSVIGLILIIVSYTVGGLIGLLFFGDAGYILNPTITEISPTVLNTVENGFGR